MIKRVQANLENKVKDYASKVRDRIQQKRKKKPNRKHSFYDYPTCVVACSYKNTKPVAKESGTCNANYYTNQKLLAEFRKLKKYYGNNKVIGEESRLCDNIIGFCAEPKAAELVLRVYHTSHFVDLNFSKAYRPRTSRVQNYCKNCKAVFPKLNKT
jgi:hypothetical protein